MSRWNDKPNRLRNDHALARIAHHIVYQGFDEQMANGYQVFTPYARSNDGIIRYYLVRNDGRSGRSEIQGTLMYVPATHDRYMFDTINEENDITPHVTAHAAANANKNRRSALKPLKRPTARLRSLEVTLPKGGSLRHMASPRRVI